VTYDDPAKRAAFVDAIAEVTADAYHLWLI